LQSGGGGQATDAASPGASPAASPAAPAAAPEPAAPAAPPAAPAPVEEAEPPAASAPPTPAPAPPAPEPPAPAAAAALPELPTSVAPASDLPPAPSPESAQSPAAPAAPEDAPAPGGTVVNPALARTPEELSEIASAEKASSPWSASGGWASKSFDSVQWPKPGEEPAPAPSPPGSPPVPAPDAKPESVPTAVPTPPAEDEPKLTGASRPFPLMPRTDGPRVAASSLERVDVKPGQETIDDWDREMERESKRETTTSRHRLLGATMAISRAHLIPELPTTHNRVVCLVSTDGDDVYYILEPHMTVGRQPMAGNQIAASSMTIGLPARGCRPRVRWCSRM
ncbi:MAG: hypothetical protein AAFX50_25280, partial [Acidobacteriota bacterium]